MSLMNTHLYRFSDKPPYFDPNQTITQPPFYSPSKMSQKTSKIPSFNVGNYLFDRCQLILNQYNFTFSWGW